MSRLPIAQRVSGHGSALPLFGIGVPESEVFPDLVQRLIDHSFLLEKRERAIREKTLLARRRTAAQFIDGLYQAFCSFLPDAAVAFPHSQQSYNQGSSRKISGHSYRNTDACYSALVSLGWVTYCTGFLDNDGNKKPTTISPAGELLKRFRESKPVWRRLKFSADPIIIRMRGRGMAQVQTLDPPDTPEVAQMREQVRQLNDFLADQAICLCLPNEDLKRLVHRMARQRYSFRYEQGNHRIGARVLNFSQVALRRIFAKGSLDRGGRLYGGWWQTIPKDYRRFITINGRPTVEVDFSEMHPTMLYLLKGQSPPENIYDLGIRGNQDPPYDPGIEPHKARRKVIKRFLNALINDERGRYRLNATDQKVLGMSHEDLLQRMLERHPLLAEVLCTDIGLYLQYLDAEIACKVMSRLKEQYIVALPVHDSFLTQLEFESELVTAMRVGFADQMNATARLKQAEMPENAFVRFGGNLTRLLYAQSDSFHDRYFRSWAQQHRYPDHLNLSQFPPYRFPDGQLAGP
jgi:hypothetical protein